MKKVTPESRQVARELKRFMVSTGMDRVDLAKATKLGKSTIDKLLTGLYSEQTLLRVFEKTKFVRNNVRAGAHLGSYYRATWTNYIADFLFLRPSFTAEHTILASRMTIEWDNDVPGLVLIENHANKSRSVFGLLSIPQERSPLIYIGRSEVPTVARSLILSIMLGDPVMRGAMLSVHNAVAHAFTPVAVPVLLRRLEPSPTSEAVGEISKGHSSYNGYRSELQVVVAKQFARAVFQY